MTESDNLDPSRTNTLWRTVRYAVLAIGLAILVALVIAPELGRHAFWNGLIPLAPALLVVAPGLWRNVCPMATAALLPRHLGISRRGTLSVEWQGRLSLFAVLLLFALVPLRHVVLDSSGPATALVLVLLAAVAVTMGFAFDWKSGWCSGLCPVHPVEKLYGSRPISSFANAHCTECIQCTTVCPDSTRSMHPFSRPTRAHRLAAVLLVGGFPGFIWAWFHVPGNDGFASWSQLGWCYGVPLLGALASLLMFLAARELVPVKHYPTLVRSFAAAAVSCYYWFRLPALVGMGVFPGEGALVDLSEELPAELPLLSGIVTTGFFGWWLVLRRAHRREWLVRPALVER
jgi:ferredoxin